MLHAVVSEELGHAGRDLDASLSPAFRAALAEGLGPARLHPRAWARELLAPLRAPGDHGRVGRELADRELSRGPYRFALRALRPDGLGAVLPALIGRAFPRTSLRIEPRAPRGCTLVWSQCEGFDDALWSLQEGMARRVLELAGRHRYEWRREGGGRDGATEMRCVTTWADPDETPTLPPPPLPVAP
ncbi:MAG: hypothetical protein CMN29_10680 [Sandaracinus sp.]|nr:hypothetical protein [Sandaracinus sp.]